MDRRQQLIEAGTTAFAEKSYHPTKVSDILRRAVELALTDEKVFP